MANEPIRKITIAGVFIAIASCVTIAGCTVEQTESEKQMDAKIENSNQVMKQTKTPKISRSLERENIRQRLLLSNDPLTLQWIYPMSAGRVIGRFPVKGKVTSGSKRLTPSTIQDTGTYDETGELPDEAGAYGSSVDYIFWFDPSGELHQHRGDYFVSPRPYTIEDAGGISSTVDLSEEKKIPTYEKQIKQTQKAFEQDTHK